MCSGFETLLLRRYLRLLRMRRCDTIFWRPGTGDQFGETSQDIKIKNRENHNKDNKHILESTAVWFMQRRLNLQLKRARFIKNLKESVILANTTFLQDDHYWQRHQLHPLLLCLRCDEAPSWSPGGGSQLCWWSRCHQCGKLLHSVQ